MKKILGIVLILLTWSSGAWGTTYTANGPGALETPTIWTPNGVPTDGDTITTAYAITINGNRTIGIDGDVGNAITINAGGSVTQVTGKLTLRGAALLNAADAVITFNPGTSLGFNSTAASKINFAVNGATVNFNGTSLSRVTVSKDGTGDGFLTGELVRGSLTATYTDFSGLKDSTNSNYWIYNKTLTGKTFTMTNCTITSCGTGLLRNELNGSYNISNNKFTSPATAYHLIVQSDVGTVTGGRTLSGNLFKGADISTSGSNVDKLVADDNIFSTSQFITGDSGTITSFDNNFFTKGSVMLNYSANGTYSNNFMYHTGASNPHFTETTKIGAVRTYTFDGNIFESSAATNNQGDCLTNLFASKNSFSVTYDIKNNIVLPNAGNFSPGNLFTAGQWMDNLVVKINNNTAAIGGTYGTLGIDQRGVAVLEMSSSIYSYLGQNIITEYRSNLAIDLSNKGYGYHICILPGNETASLVTGTATAGDATTLTDSSKEWVTNIFTSNGSRKIRLTSGANIGSVGTIVSNTATVVTIDSWSIGPPSATDTYKIFVVDAVTPAGVGYNASANAANGELYDTNGAIVGSGQGNHYHQYSGSTGLGGTDIGNIDPSFVDSTRDLASWDASLGGVGTAANAIAQLEAGTEGYTNAALLSYIRGGFTPTNVALSGTGYGGVDIGAVAVQLLTIFDTLGQGVPPNEVFNILGIGGW